MHKFIHTFAKYNLQIPNTNAVPISIAVTVPGAIADAVPLADADAEPLPKLCPWSISLHKFIYTFVIYNLQMPNTNAVPISISVAVLIAVANHGRGCALGQCWCRGLCLMPVSDAIS